MTDRRNITQPEDWWEQFDRQSARENLTLSEWIGKTCKSALPAIIRKKLSPRPSVGRPKQEAEK